MSMRVEDIEFPGLPSLPPADAYESNDAQEDQPGYGAVLIDLRDIEVRDVEWHDEGFLPKGLLAILQGHGGVNKGTLACQWAAMLTKSSFVLFVVSEDDYATMLKPRLIAAGANVARIRCIDFRRGGQEDALRIPDDLLELQRVIEETAAGLVVIDPLLTHLAGTVDSYRGHEVKRALGPLGKLAAATNCTILGVHHFTKDTGKGARHSGQASEAFGNTARVVLAMAADAEDITLRVLEVVKCNIGPEGLRRNVRVELVRVDGLSREVPKTVFAGPADKTVDELLAAKRQPQRVPKIQVQDVVLRELAAGEKSRHDLDDAAHRELGVNADTVYKSALEPLKRDGLIEARKGGFDGGWYWLLTKSDNDWCTEPAPVQDVYPSSAAKPKNGAADDLSIFEDGYPSTSADSGYLEQLFAAEPAPEELES
jgi:hypothetical protein